MKLNYERLLREWISPGHLLGFLALIMAIVAAPARADDTELALAKSLVEKGVQLSETKGAVTAITIADGSKLTD